MLAILETLTLGVLLVNVAGVHRPRLAELVGPVHGCLYLAAVLLSWTTPLPRVAKIIAVVPVIGAWTVVLRVRRG